MGTVRVKPEVACVVFDEVTKGFVTLVANTPFDSGDPFVKSHSWAFESDTEAAERGKVAGPTTSVNMDSWVETATAIPGEKRNVQPGTITTESFAPKIKKG